MGFHLSIGSVRNRTEHLIDRIAAERFSWWHRNPELSNQGAGPPQVAQTNSTAPPTGAGAIPSPGDALTRSTRYAGALPRRGTQERSSQAPEDQDPLAAARQYRIPMPGSRTPKHGTGSALDDMTHPRYAAAKAHPWMAEAGWEGVSHPSREAEPHISGRQGGAADNNWDGVARPDYELLQTLPPLDTLPSLPVVNQQMHALHWQLQDALQDLACLSSLTCLASLATLSQCRVQAPLNPAHSSSLKGAVAAKDHSRIWKEHNQTTPYPTGPKHGTQGFEQEHPSGRSSSQPHLNRPQASPSRATWTADSHQPSPKSSQAKPTVRYLGGTSIKSAQQSSIRHARPRGRVTPGGYAPGLRPRPGGYAGLRTITGGEATSSSTRSSRSSREFTGAAGGKLRNAHARRRPAQAKKTCSGVRLTYPIRVLGRAPAQRAGQRATFGVLTVVTDSGS
eukprot:gene26569-18336_t